MEENCTLQLEMNYTIDPSSDTTVGTAVDRSALRKNFGEKVVRTKFGQCTQCTSNELPRITGTYLRIG